MKETYLDWSTNNIRKNTGISFLTGNGKKIFGCEKCIYNSGEHTCLETKTVELKINSADAMKLSSS